MPERRRELERSRVASLAAERPFDRSEDRALFRSQRTLHANAA